MIRNSLKKYLKLENTSIDFMDSLLSKEEIMEEANYRLKLAKWKWEEYLNEDKPNREIPMKPEKPAQFHLKTIQKLKYVTWNSLKLANIHKFNLKGCPHCE